MKATKLHHFNGVFIFIGEMILITWLSNIKKSTQFSTINDHLLTTDRCRFLHKNSYQISWIELASLDGALIKSETPCKTLLTWLLTLWKNVSPCDVIDFESVWNRSPCSCPVETVFMWSNFWLESCSKIEWRLKVYLEGDIRFE